MIAFTLRSLVRRGTRRCPLYVAAALLVTATRSEARQPCDSGWLRGEPLAGVDRWVFTINTYDRDGDGPIPGTLVVGGLFESAGGIPAKNIGAWDGETWLTLGSGLEGGRVLALSTFDEDGAGPQPDQLIAGGSFNSSSGVALNGVGRWNGSAWEPMGAGFVGRVESLATFDPDGQGSLPPGLFAGGTFVDGAGGLNHIARWDGVVWQPVDEGLNSDVLAMTAFDPDEAGPQPARLIVAGEFTFAPGAGNAVKIASWDGARWRGLGTGMNDDVYAVSTFDPDGGGPAPEQLIAAGRFTAAGGISANRIARWDGATWQALGSGMNGDVRALATLDPDADGPLPPRLIAAGSFTAAGGVAVSNAASWDGSTWSSIGAEFNAVVHALAPFDPDGAGPGAVELIAGGVFTAASDQSGGGLARWAGFNWGAVGTGLNERVHALVQFDPDGDGASSTRLFAAGQFTIAGPNPTGRVAQWDGSGWSPLDPGFGLDVFALTTTDPDGAGPQPPMLIAGCEAPPQRGTPQSSVFRLDNGFWQPVGSDWVNGSVLSLVSFDFDGPGPLHPSIVAGGEFDSIGSRVAVWNGSVWSGLASGMDAPVLALASFDSDGGGPLPAQLVAGGYFKSPANFIARWDGSAWLPLGTGTDGPIQAMAAFDPDGPGPSPDRLVAAGGFFEAGGIPARSVALWDGVAWAPLGDGLDGDVYALTVFDADGTGASLPQLIAGGIFTASGPNPINRLAAWNGSSWQPLGAGTNTSTLALTSFDPDGPTGPALPRLCVGGNFTQAGGNVSAYFAQWGNDTALWKSAASGVYGSSSNWLCNLPPTKFDRLFIDAAQAGYSPGASFQVTIPAGSGTTTARTLTARTDAVTLDLQGNAFTLTGGSSSVDDPGLIVGELPTQPAALILKNSSGGSPADFTTSAMSLADQTTTAPRLNSIVVQDRATRLVVNGAAFIGRRGNEGRLTVQSGGDAVLGGTLSVADQLGSVGKVEVTGAGSTVLYGGINTSAGIGVNGAATLDVSSGGLLASAASVDILTVGTLTGATVNATISGAGSTWSTDQKYAFFGYAGDVVFGITNAGQLLTTTSGDVYVSRFAESLSTLTLRDAGSRWREATSPIRIGPAGTIDIGPGAAVECPSLIVTGGGLLTGTGEVRGLTGGAVIPINNGGTISPRSTSGGVGVLTLNADLTMSASRDGVTTAGTIAADLAGTTPAEYDRIDLTGSATLSGALRVRLTSGFDPPVGSRFTVLTAANGISGRFDVAYFPGLAGRFFRIDYVTGAQRIVTSVDVVVESQSARGAFDPNDYSAPGAPSGADLGDLNADTFPDLVLTIPDAGNPEANPGQVAVLINAGNSGPAWNGFVPSSQVTFNTGRNPQEVVIARLRGNAQPNDLAVACAADNTVQTFSNSGLAVFTPSGTFSSGGLRPLDIDAADFTGDGVADLAVANYGDINPPPEQQLPDRGNARILNNNGSGAFTPADTLTTGWYPLSLALADLNADGRTDLATADSGTSEVSVFMRPTGGGPGWNPRHIYPTGAPPATVEPGGLDNPKDLNDLAIVTTPAVATIPSIGVLLNLDDGSGDLAPVVNLDVGGFSRGLAPVDLDDDGDQDLAVIVQGATPSSSSVRLLRNNTPPNSPGGVTLALEPTPLATNNPALILAGDVNTDGVEDLVTINTDTVLLRAGGSAGDTNDSPSAAPARDGPDRGSKSPQRVTVALASAPPPACVGDFNGDNQVGTPDLVYLIGRFGQTFQPPGSEPADLNADGVVSTPDLVAFIGRFGSACP